MFGLVDWTQWSVTLFFPAVAVRLVGAAGGVPPPTIIGLLSVLLLSLLSAIRLISSTLATIVCVPTVAVQVLEPLGPPFAVTVREAPGSSDAVLLSDQVTGVPSTENSTPWITPAGVGAVPWFLMVALNVTALPGAGLAGDQLTSVTIKSGWPEPGTEVTSG